jgi:ribosomal-protein-alanine N-acetyltransferase
MADLFPARMETDRLALEAMTREFDTFDLYEHVREGAPHIEAITEYLTWDPHETPKKTREFIETAADDREADAGSTYVVRPLAGEDGAGELAGLASIDVDWDARRATLGTWLRKRFWGRGYSGERAAALLALAFDRLDLATVVVSVQRGNEQSRRAVSGYVEAHGGRHEGLLRNAQGNRDGSVVDIHRYSVTCEEFEAATGE